MSFPRSWRERWYTCSHEGEYPPKKPLWEFNKSDWIKAAFLMRDDELDNTIENLWDRWNFVSGDQAEKELLDFLCDFRLNKDKWSGNGGDITINAGTAPAAPGGNITICGGSARGVS